MAIWIDFMKIGRYVREDYNFFERCVFRIIRYKGAFRPRRGHYKYYDDIREITIMVGNYALDIGWEV